jgi:primosomal protein N' (replication factor Y)
LLQVKSARFEPRFSYAVPEGLKPEIGDVVTVMLGSRRHYGYVVCGITEQPFNARFKYIEPCPGVPRAFSAEMLSLAEWLAEYYCCSLNEALSTMVPSSTIPRTVERLIPLDRSIAADIQAIPPRFIEFLWDDFPAGISADELLRHAEARRSGDRATLRRFIRILTEHGALSRERLHFMPTMGERTVRVLRAGPAEAHGIKAQALRELVITAGEFLSSEAVLAGYSRAVIRQCLKNNALVENEVPVGPKRRSQIPAPPKFLATTEQAQAIERLHALASNKAFNEALIHGITGSGKTFVYLEFIRRLVERGESAIVLVPEIALTPQTSQRFEAIFGDQVVVLHSALSDRERFEGRRAAQNGEVRVVVGARSAVFTPIPNLRAIIVDEAHETSYKQDSAPRYHAVVVARERMRRAEGMLVLGSATPPLEEYARAKLGRAELITLRERATAASLPDTRIVDMTKEPKRERDTVFSVPLLQSLQQCLLRKEKALLFVNRRGSAGFVLCRSCAYVPKCKRCSLSLTFHARENLLRCHLCDAQEAMHEFCPRCGQTPFKPFGIGTERVVQELEALFPDAKVVRMDSDTTTRLGDHARLLKLFEDEGDILVGTQMIAKGLDFEAVTLAAVLAADIGLHHADYHASERTFDLLTQVAGRSGRALAGTALIQTYLPDHPAIHFASEHNYEGFARVELQERRALAYPPFSKLTYLGVIGRNREAVQNFAKELAEVLRRARAGEILGPAFYPVARVNEEWRMRVAVKAPSHATVREAILRDVLPMEKKTKGIRVAINLDP